MDKTRKIQFIYSSRLFQSLGIYVTKSTSPCNPDLEKQQKGKTNLPIIIKKKENERLF